MVKLHPHKISEIVGISESDVVTDEATKKQKEELIYYEKYPQYQHQ